MRKKVRAGVLTAEEADLTWDRFAALKIEYVDDMSIRQSAWMIAARFGLSTQTTFGS